MTGPYQQYPPAPGPGDSDALPYPEPAYYGPPTGYRQPPYPRRRAGRWLVALGAGVVVVVVVVVVAALVSGSRAASQVVVPFEDIAFPSHVGLDAAGNVYVGDDDGDRVVRLDPASGEQTVLSFDLEADVYGMAVSPNGDVYVVDGLESLAVIRAGDDDPEEVDIYQGSERSSFFVNAISVDADENLWLVDGVNDELLMFDGSDLTTEAELPSASFTSILAMRNDQSGYAVIYDSDAEEYSVRQWHGDDEWDRVPPNDIHRPSGLAVDDAGALYMTDARLDRVLKLEAGAQNWTELPFSGLNDPTGIAVGTDGAVYVADTSNSRVVKLSQG